MDTALRSRPGRLLLAAALLCALTLGVAFVVVHRVYDLRGITAAQPMTDDQSRRQVMDATRAIVAAGAIENPDATYLLGSCSTEDQPPYQGTVYLTFDVAGVVETSALFRRMARSMTAQGWRVGEPPGRHPGGWTLADGRVTAIYYRDPDLEGKAVLQVYGECRNRTDHRLDGASFVDVSADLRG